MRKKLTPEQLKISKAIRIIAKIAKRMLDKELNNKRTR